MCAHINSLSDECLLLTFDLIPLCDLFHLDQVCHRWAFLLPSACARRRTLVLILDADRSMDIHIPLNSAFDMSFNVHYPSYDLSVAKQEASITFPFLMLLSKTTSFDDFLSDDDDQESQAFFDVLYSTSIGDETEVKFTELARLRHARLVGRQTTYFTSLFPNIKTFVVVHSRCTENELRLLIDLINSWSLANLKLWLQTWNIDEKYEDFADQHPVRTLLQSINRQSSLQRLTLDINGELPDYGEDDDPVEFTFPLELYSFIARLEVAKLYLGNYGREIWDIVHHFDSVKLRQICLGNYYNVDIANVDIDNTVEYPPATVALDPKFEFSHKVAQLCGYYWRFKSIDQFGEFCCRFASLTMLQMDWKPNITFTALVSNLAALTQLTHLELVIIFRAHPTNAFALVQQVGSHERPISLPQVKILELFFEKRTRHDFDSLSPLVFPSVELIILDDSTDDDTHSLGDAQKEVRCHRLLVRSLKTKFAAHSLVRLYARDGLEPFVDWTNYVPTEDDYDLSENDGQRMKKEKLRKKKMKMMKVKMIAMKRKMAAMRMMMKKRRNKMMKRR